MVKEQGGVCALCSEPGSADGLVVDTDDLRKTIRGLVHPEIWAGSIGDASRVQAAGVRAIVTLPNIRSYLPPCTIFSPF